MHSLHLGQRPSLNLLHIKRGASPLLNEDPSSTGGSLSPDIQCNSPALPAFTGQSAEAPSVKKIGNYLLFGGLVDSSAAIQVQKAVHCATQEEFICKVLPVEKYRDILAPYFIAGSHDHISEMHEIILGSERAYVLFRRNYDDLHSYIRKRRKLKEMEASVLFRQVASAVRHCHRNGIVLRDLKLRKLVFKDPQRTQLRLEGLEDGCLLADETDDRMTDKHGCPAYVSPEILCSKHGYSGRAADVWSLGVVLYTMLVGQYPFHDSDAGTLFGKIRRAHYTLPETMSGQARCLIRSLLRTDPLERLSIEDVLKHPWFTYCASRPTSPCSKVSKEKYHQVPDVPMEECQDFFSE